ncbi:MAG: DUF6443 domain-containing protein [Pseudobacter sp.]|uniref:DUF6443 domain-containing protein n=1 Tax=Pseudobacter sp. TaxID=2045420 RepID=UPI003F803ACA
MPKQRAYPDLILTVAVLLISVLSDAQVTPPPAYPANTKINYVRTWEATAPEQNPAVLVTRPLRDVKQTTVYVDGLGRPIQSVLKQGSLSTGSAPVDLVSPIVYDAFGREEYKYLPFAANSTGSNSSINDGNFKLNPFQQQAAFGAAQYPGETYFYSRTQYEASPLSRIEKSLAPGESWVGTNRGLETKLWINTTADDVKIWTVIDNPGTFGSYVASGSYPAGSLLKIVTMDEAGHQLIEFKDKLGNVILKKTQLSATTDNGSGKGHTGFLNTYYIYDDLNNLRCIIQPKGVELISATAWTLSDATILAEQCFRYEYDEKKRISIKQVPGAGDVYMIYDARDRLVFFQDANMRSTSQWKSTLYDALNRQVLTGLITYNGSREALQMLVTLQTGGTINNITIPADLPLNQPTGSGTYYATNSITLDPGFESEEAAEISLELINSNGSSDETPFIIEGVSVNRNPLPASASLLPLTFTYYDNYQWAASLNNNLKNFSTTTINNYLLSPGTNYPYPEPVTASNTTSGMATGGKVRILDSEPARYLISVNFYDINNRLAQTRSQNSTGGYDAVTTQYNWAGQPIGVIQELQKTNPNAQTHTIFTSTSYDDLGRVLNVNKTINSIIAGSSINKQQQEILRNEYNALGQLKKKNIGNDIEQLDYDYNIRGWLLGVNRNFIKDDNQRYFGYELGYDKSPAIINGSSYLTSQYNGNISGTTWKSAGDNKKRKFDYTYDAANRLLSADFNQYSGSGFSKPNGINFSIGNLTYDANGNILSMQQYGWKTGEPGALLDNLSYTYYDKGNKLKNVIDASNDVNTNLGDFRSSQLYMSTLGTKANTATDYLYDNNGNLKKDLNKDIGSASSDGIVYNILNLPQSITVQKSGGLKGIINYVYDAAGIKHQKIVTEVGQSPKNTLYLGGAVYQNDTLQFFSQEEGRIRYTKHYFSNGDSTWEYNYDYFIKDHLGNVRMILTEQKDTAVYAATMESNFRTKEEKLFNKVGSTAFPTPVFYPQDISVTNPNNYVSRLTGATGQKQGISIILKVMGGDHVKIFAKSFYQPNTVVNENAPVAEIVAGIANSMISVTGASKGSLAQLTDISGPLTSGVGLFRTNHHTNSSSKPKAYLNWILFDEQLNFVDDGVSSGADQVGTANELKPHLKNVQIPQNGFFYIYTSNESPDNAVFFNDLIIEHQTGKILEETHYYPFGSAMAALSSKAPGRLENTKQKFNNAEINNDLDLNTYEFFYRNYDQQIGRWWQLDPKPNEAASLYSAMGNNPISNYDPLGDTTIYYTHDGQYLFSTNDKLENAVIVIPEANQKSFFARHYNAYGLVPYNKKSDDAMSKDLRAYGVGYSTDEYFSYYDKNANDQYKGKDGPEGTDVIKPVDGKGPLINEHAASTSLKNGFVRIIEGTDAAGTPLVSSPKAGFLGVHTHSAEGRRIGVQQSDGSYRTGTVESGKAGLGDDTPGSSSVTNASKGNFRVVVTPTHMYLYGNGQVMISVDRKLTPSQNPSSIK